MVDSLKGCGLVLIPKRPGLREYLPVTARHFGDLNDPESDVAKIITSTPTFRLREDLGTEPNVYYIPPEGLAL